MCGETPLSGCHLTPVGLIILGCLEPMWAEVSQGLQGLLAPQSLLVRGRMCLCLTYRYFVIWRLDEQNYSASVSAQKWDL